MIQAVNVAWVSSALVMLALGLAESTETELGSTPPLSTLYPDSLEPSDFTTFSAVVPGITVDTRDRPLDRPRSTAAHPSGTVTLLADSGPSAHTSGPLLLDTSSAAITASAPFSSIAGASTPTEEVASGNGAPPHGLVTGAVTGALLPLIVLFT